MRSILLGLAMLSVGSASAAPLILNEYNAVGSTKFLKNNNSDSYFGTIQGNGGNWIELVVTQDHLDIRNWQLRWYENDPAADGTAIWDPTRTVVGQDAQGAITFSNNAAWSNLRAGTILTISELTSAGGHDLTTDLSFNPAANDWWIQVSSGFEAAQSNPLVTTTSNVTGALPGDFNVGNNNWELQIWSPSLGTVFGPIGEAIVNWAGGGIGSDEVGKLQFPSSTVTAADWQNITDGSNYFDGSSSTFGSANVWSQGQFVQDMSALRTAVPETSTIVLAGMAIGSLIVVRRVAKN